MVCAPGNHCITATYMQKVEGEVISSITPQYMCMCLCACTHSVSTNLRFDNKLLTLGGLRSLEFSNRRTFNIHDAGTLLFMYVLLHILGRPVV